MSAISGIGVSEDLSQVFSSAVGSGDVRFVKVVIRDESLVPEETIPIVGDFDEDLEKLQNILTDGIPAYILACIDPLKSEWLAISFVPDNAKVRDKMLYASTRNSLTKSLGATHFIDALFATSKEDLTPKAYAAHRVHMSAPKPMSAREQEAEATKIAERQAGAAAYGSIHDRDRNEPVGYSWPEDVDSAMKDVADGDDDHLIVFSLDTATEKLNLVSSKSLSVDDLSNALPKSEPCYAFFAWRHDGRRDVVFIYSCPTSSPVKYRMMYSSGSLAVRLKAKEYFASGSSILSERRVETSDPSEINKDFIVSALGLPTNGQVNSPGKSINTEEKKVFARPKAPGRKR